MTIRLIEAYPSTAAIPPRPGQTPPPLRLPRFLQEQLSRPLNTPDDVDALIAQIRAADARGLL